MKTIDTKQNFYFSLQKYLKNVVNQINRKKVDLIGIRKANLEENKHKTIKIIYYKNSSNSTLT